MRRSFSDIYFTTEQQQRILNSASPGDALEHYYKNFRAAEKKEDAYGIALNCEIIGGILARFDVNKEAVEYYEKAIKCFKELLDGFDREEGIKVKNIYPREYEGSTAKKHRNTEEIILNREDIEHHLLWSMLELAYIYVFNNSFDEYDALLSNFTKQANELGYLNDENFYKEMEEIHKDPTIEKLRINVMKSWFDPVLVHHVELLKVMCSLMKYKKITTEEAQRYAQIMYLSDPSRHLDYTVIIYYSILDSGNIELAKCYLDRIKDMDDGCVQYDLSYRQAAADFYLRTGEDEKFLEELEIIDKLMSRKRQEFKYSKNRTLINEETAFSQLQKMNEYADEIKKVTEKASTDTLTQLPNRYAIYETLPEIINEAAEKDEEIAIVLIDVDHFKFFNDTYGHRAGDDCLICVSDTLREVYTGCFVARFGGDEFLAVLSGEKTSEASKYAEKVRTILNHKKIEGVDQNATVTQGVAITKAETDMSWQRLFEHADNSLYKGKNGVRNCIVSIRL